MPCQLPAERWELALEIPNAIETLLLDFPVLSTGARAMTQRSHSTAQVVLCVLLVLYCATLYVSRSSRNNSRDVPSHQVGVGVIARHKAQGSAHPSRLVAGSVFARAQPAERVNLYTRCVTQGSIPEASRLLSTGIGNALHGLRGWRCTTQPSAPCLLPIDFANRAVDVGNRASHKTITRRASGDVIKHDSDWKRTTCVDFHLCHPKDVPCETVRTQGVDVDAQATLPRRQYTSADIVPDAGVCVCPPPYPNPEAQGPSQVGLTFGKGDKKWYPGFWRPSKQFANDPDRTGDPNYETSGQRNRCHSANRAKISPATLALVRESNFSKVIALASKQGFEKTFVHSGPMAKHTLTKEKKLFDWAMLGQSDKDTPAAAAERWHKPKGGVAAGGLGPTTVIFPANHRTFPEFARAISPFIRNPAPRDKANPNRPYRVLVLLHSDYGVAHFKAEITELLYTQYFDRILIYAFDREFPGLHVVPAGFQIHYTRNLHTEPHILDALRNPVPFGEKKRGFVAAWGAAWKHLDAMDSRRRLEHWLEKSSLGGRSDIAPKDWWKTLAKYRFQLCPPGKGVQSPKHQEAWLTQTVTVIEDSPAYKEMNKWGYPVVVVKSLDMVTQANMDKWWDEMWPKLRVVPPTTPLSAMRDFPCHLLGPGCTRTR